MKHDTFLSVILLCLFTSRCTGTPYIYNGTYINFLTSRDIGNTDVVSTLYESCRETANDSHFSDGSVCVTRLLAKMLQAIVQVSAGSRSVAVANSTTVYINQTVPVIARQVKEPVHLARSASKPTIGPNKRQNERSTSRLRVAEELDITDVVRSSIHPHDGSAVRFNIQANTAVLQVDHNRTHASARFVEDTPAMAARDVISTNGYSYQFTGNVSGIKVEAHGINRRSYDIEPDINAFAYAFAYGCGDSTTFKSSNSWSYRMCEQTTSMPLFDGKIVAELYQPGSNYESVDVTTLSC